MVRPGGVEECSAFVALGVGANRVFTDKLSGSANTARPGLVALLDYARPSDTVFVTAIDRLGRSVAEVTRTIVHGTYSPRTGHNGRGEGDP